MERKWQFRNSRVFSLIVLVGILFMALNKLMISSWLGDGVMGLIALVGIDDGQFQQMVKSLTQGKWGAYKIGYFLYYPIYISLHLLFIYFLFFDSKKVRWWLIIGVLGVIALLLSIIGISALLDLTRLQNASYKLFARLFGLPFILLAIEGGKVLYADIRKRLELTQQNHDK